MARSFLFTSESVTEGHPDKMADQVSDAILDAILAGDKHPAHARVAVETLFKTGLCIVAGEVRTSAVIDVPAIVRRTINRIGFDHTTLYARHYSTLRTPIVSAPELAESRRKVHVARGKCGRRRA